MSAIMNCIRRILLTVEEVQEEIVIVVEAPLNVVVP